jgi:methyl-accepting chemotaxis protein
MFRMLLAALLLPALFLGYALYKVGAINNDLSHVSASRYTSYLLADELRQSSDDLTRLARTYVVSGDPEWEKQYFEILDIRNGKKAAPTSTKRSTGTFGLRVPSPRAVRVKPFPCRS